MAALLLAGPAPVRADWDSCATDWDNFFSRPEGFVTDYTYRGENIRDFETSADPSHGPAAVPPSQTDLASGSPADYPGAYTTPAFGYYNGGTVWDQNDPATLLDDYIFFRIRVQGDPVAQQGDFTSYHWNILLDVDGDGYKEFWVDLEGSCSGNACNPPTSGTDRLNILYDNQNRQDIPDPDDPGVRVDYFSASSLVLASGSCPAGSPGQSMTRVTATNDGTGDYWIDVQVPMWAFRDSDGNQVLYPDSPVAFVYSTSASNTNPLQKDFMMDLEFLSLADPIQFGDTVTPSGIPSIDFTDSDLASVSYYMAGDQIFITLTDVLYNDTPERQARVDCFEVTVADPFTGDDERVTLCETGPNTGVFSNLGGRSLPGGVWDGAECVQATPFPPATPPPPSAWLEGFRTSTSTVDETWAFLFLGGTTWGLAGSDAGVQGLVSADVAYSSPADPGAPRVSFTLRQDSPTLLPVTLFTVCTRAADPLPSSTLTGGVDNDGTLRVNPGDMIYVSYTNALGQTVTDAVPILGPCSALVEFTRRDGRVSDNFILTDDPDTSDKLYVTVTYPGANLDPATAETITVTLTGNDTQTLTLAETGPDTGTFRNVTGLDTQISDGSIAPEDGLWEDVDGGTVTATYDYVCGGSPLSASQTASLFASSEGGRVYFSNGAGTADVNLYTQGQPVFVRVVDTTACPPISVTVTTSSGDSETIAVGETAPGSGVYMNRVNDLVTSAGSAQVTSASSTFVTDGVAVDDYFAIANGPDTGTYRVVSVDGETALTLDRSLTASRTDVSFSAQPLMTAVFDGVVTTDDGWLEAAHDDTLTVSYTDCDDGDLDPGNDVKTDTAVFNAPGLILNRVLFSPDDTTCQSELIVILNPTALPIVATGYRVTDEDGELEYTVPDWNGGDLTLQPGARIVLTVGSYYQDFEVGGDFYLFASNPTYPSTLLGGLGDADPADQVLLYAAGGSIVDYVGWSATLTPSLDFQSDDTAAVLADIWQDDAFTNVASTVVGQAIARVPSGFDTNSPADWLGVEDTTCTTIAELYATRATIIGVRVDPAGVVEFVTGSQQETRGFHVYASSPSPSGQPALLTPELVPAPVPDSHWPIPYRVDTGPIEGDWIWIEEIEIGGEAHLMGPFRVGDRWLEHGLERVKARIERLERKGRRRPGLRWLAPDDRAGKAHRKARRPRRGWSRAHRGRAPGGAKLVVGQAGNIVVPLSDLEAHGISVRSLRSLQLSNLGRRVPFWRGRTADDQPALVFRAEPLSTLYTDENVYLLTRGPAPRPRVPLSVPGEPVPAGFSRVEKSVLYLPSAPLGSDPWLWDFLWDGWPWPDPSWDPLAGHFDLPGLGGEPEGDVEVKVRFLAYSDHQHRVDVTLNGLFLGTIDHSGRGLAVLSASVPAAALRATGNELSLGYTSNASEPGDFGWMYLDGLDIGLPGLLVGGPGELRAIAEYDPALPRLRRAEYLIVTHGDFAAQAEAIAAAKRAEGLATVVVDVERAYDRFSSGLTEARAVRELVRRAARGGRLRFVLLVGDDTFDYRDDVGMGAVGYVPSLYAWDDVFGLVPSENRYADTDDDGRPDLAIGRLPVKTPEEATLLAEKIAGQAALLAESSGRHLMVVDNQGPRDLSYVDEARSVVAQLPPDSTVSWSNIAEGVSVARADLVAAWERGAMVTHYFGHGGPEVWADESLVATWSAPILTENARPTVLFTWTCQTQWYQYLWSDTVNEALLLAPQGAVASFGPVGITSPADQKEIYSRVYGPLFDERLTLGEAILQAKREAAEKTPASRVVVEGFALLGDPALRLP
jgi:hypothetical protein